MPFRLFQRLLTAALLLAMLILQVEVLPLWMALSHMALFILALSHEGRPGIRLAFRVIASLAVLFLLYHCFVNRQWVPLVITLLTGTILLFLATPFSYRAHFSLFLITAVSVSVVILTTSSSIWIIVSLFVYIFLFVLSSFSLLLRHDIEHHHIIKHRLGRESRRVEVDRLLNSKKVLDSDLTGFLIFTSGVIAIAAGIFTWVLLPFFPLEGFGTAHDRPRFPGIFDLNRLGAISTSSGVRVTLDQKSGIPLKGRIYLKGRVLGQYNAGVWYPQNPAPVRTTPPKTGSASRFIVSSRYSSPFGFTLPHTIHAQGRGGSSCHVTPLGTMVTTAGGRAQCEIFVTKSSPDAPFASPLYISTLGIPRRVMSLAGRLNHGVTTPSAKVATVLSYLRSYPYGTTYTRPQKGEDPIVTFLFRTKRGPCGLFASSAVLLLRAMGVRARLITGFSTEHKKGSTVSFRGRDAHSWLEVYIPGTGWQIVDPTLSIRIPEPQGRASALSKSTFTIVMSLLLPGAAVLFLFLFVLVRSKKPRPLAPNAVTTRSRGTQAPSITTFQASMIFTEITNTPLYVSTPRQPGESALNYARRLSRQDHPAGDLLSEAATIANTILFAGLEQGKRDEGIARLKEILASLPRPDNKGDR